MLSKNAVVKARKALESMYDGFCTVTEYQEYTKPNKSTGHREVVTLESKPCRMSFSSVNPTLPTGTASQLGQAIKVFLSPEVQVKPGSKLIITQNGVTTEYKSSGEPSMYATHQEIALELFKGWS